MLIGEISDRTGLSRDTIRFYEKKGLIKVSRTDSEWNNYKNYNQQNLDRLILIKRAKGFGFTLNEICEILELYEINSANCATLLTKVNKKIDEIDSKIKQLEALKKTIIDKVNDANNNCQSSYKNENCSSIQRE
ncbi:MerR family DNA-binding protein [Croceitalea marina]|uniref:MerR family DNA-binding protein n=1 Tax=Croceitalea marina TaxID=1775166 RepID=A0ABW5N3V1_9FLAO